MCAATAAARPAALAFALLAARAAAFVPGNALYTSHVRVPPAPPGPRQGAAAQVPPPRRRAPGPAMAVPSSPDERNAHFMSLAAKSNLARFAQAQITLDGVNVMVPYHLAKDVESYTQWMPLCTSGVPTERGPTGETTKCMIAFEVDTKTFFGRLGDNVSYFMALTPPHQIGTNQAQASVVTDSEAGFAFGERIRYDWVFTMNETAPGEYRTEVALSLFLHIKSFPLALIWDAMEEELARRLLQAFEDRARSMETIPSFELGGAAKTPAPMHAAATKDKFAVAANQGKAAIRANSENLAMATRTIVRENRRKDKSRWNPVFRRNSAR